MTSSSSTLPASLRRLAGAAALAAGALLAAPPAGAQPIHGFPLDAALPAPIVRVLQGGTIATSGHRFVRAAVTLQMTTHRDGADDLSSCSGVLIERDLVLTAAHCVDAVERPSDVRIDFFETGLKVTASVKADAISVHPRFPRGVLPEDLRAEERQRRAAADMALIHLESEAPASKRPIALADDPILLAGARQAFIAGTGLEGDVPNAREGVLKIGKVALSRHLINGPSIAYLNALGGRVCFGDSGAPIATIVDGELRLWALVSAIFTNDNAASCGEKLVVVLVDRRSPDFERMLLNVKSAAFGVDASH